MLNSVMDIQRTERKNLDGGKLMKRKIIAMTLCVVMLLSFMSIGGSALSGEAEYSPVESNISLNPGFRQRLRAMRKAPVHCLTTTVQPCGTMMKETRAKKS